jgi:hypothetical protein
MLTINKSDLLSHLSKLLGCCCLNSALPVVKQQGHRAALCWCKFLLLTMFLIAVCLSAGNGGVNLMTPSFSTPRGTVTMT